MVGRRRLALVAALAVLASVAGFAGVRPVAAASPDLTISTPYPAVSIAPGSKESFSINVITAQAIPVALQVLDAPKGWTATLRGGGWQIASVLGDPKTPPAVSLDIVVPADAAPGAYKLAVVGQAGTFSDRLDMTFNVAQAAGGSVAFETDFPQLRGASSATFTFNLTLRNDTPRKLTFSINGVGPEGWDVKAEPAGQAQATTASVDPQATGSITVTVTPPAGATAGTYDIDVKAVAGDVQVAQKLQVDIIGSYTVSLSTPNQVLSVSGTVGTPITQQLTVTNTGSAELTGVKMSATPPTGWKVTFAPDSIASIPANQKVDVVATIEASSDAIAGDYGVTVEAATSDANASLALRVTVQTSLSWMIVGIALIALALLGLGWVFRRYGRR
jgi:uncharacterized membrane protein